VNFQSFNSYFSLADGCTTFSFAVNLGIFLSGLASAEESAIGGRPKESQCHFRSKLFKEIVQRTYSRKDIWYVDQEGLNLLDVLDDARRVVLSNGISWFDHFSQPGEVLRTLAEVNEDDSLFGIGAKWSPRRKLLIGRAAVHAGEQELGLRVLREAEAEMQSIRLQIESLGRNRRRLK